MSILTRSLKGVFTRQRRDCNIEDCFWNSAWTIGIPAGHEWTAQLLNTGSPNYDIAVYGLWIYAPTQAQGVNVGPWKTVLTGTPSNGQPVRIRNPKGPGVTIQQQDNPNTFSNFNNFPPPIPRFDLVGETPLWILMPGDNLAVDFNPVDGTQLTLVQFLWGRF